jgi:hypothetical protein
MKDAAMPRHGDHFADAGKVILTLHAPSCISDLLDWTESALRAGFTKHAINIILDAWLLRGLP